MASKAVCRIGDHAEGTCRAVNNNGHPRHFVGTWQTGSDIIKCDGIAVVLVGDTGVTDCGHTFVAIEGSTTTGENGVAIHRVGDAVEVIGGGEGVSTTGSGTASSE